MDWPATSQIVAARPAKNRVDPRRPYAFLLEQERSERGELQPVATLFLTNRECPFRCLMCDLWKNTTDDTVPHGAIPAQIEYALQRLAPARRIKLYNSGNFFDPKAIPPADHESIARLVSSFERVIVENHPKLCDDRVLRFRDLLATQLEVALGLETIHPETLSRLNKQMTVDDFRRAATWLVQEGISVRAFVLLKPPGMSETEGIEWAVRSINFAWECGVTCCAVIATRPGNGIMESLAKSGVFAPPRIESLETVMERVLPGTEHRVFADLWELEALGACPRCTTRRLDRLRIMNQTQTVPPSIECDHESFH